MTRQRPHRRESAHVLVQAADVNKLRNDQKSDVVGTGKYRENSVPTDVEVGR